MNWNLLKSEVESMLATAPQRGARAARAIQQIEAGFMELAAVGYQFEPQLRGALQAMESGQQEARGSRPMSIEDASRSFKRPTLVENSGSGSEIFADNSPIGEITGGASYAK